MLFQRPVAAQHVIRDVPAQHVIRDERAVTWHHNESLQQFARGHVMEDEILPSYGLELEVNGGGRG